jgi:hypothetical protein
MLKRFYVTNTVRHVLVFRRVCSYHGVYSFVFEKGYGHLVYQIGMDK